MMKRFFLTPSNLFVVIVTTNMIYGSPLSIIRLLAHNRAYSRSGLNKDINNHLDDGKNYENSISVDDSVATGDINLQDNQQDWTKITKNPASPITATVGNRIELRCEANGSPPPQILWLRGNDPEKQLTEFLGKSTADLEISSDGWEGLGQVVSKLVIECVTPNDQGLIYCASVAGKKMQLSSPTLLLVKDKDNGNNNSCIGENKPTITLHSPMRFALIGSTVVLPCRATGKLRPYTYWLDNNNAVIHSSSNPRYKILRNGDLVIDPLKWTDMGSLTCYAKSDYQEDSATTFLYPMVDEKKAL
ncbi:PREDICTED: neural/ectodermal development factor IMP-L2 isoform X1 [Polistes dominula]|uniref:Neural/ectodermal development factor IMP-L2 isoform X1 n=1 Tax=Polistes dominula TaxID=743375 RepID=A0ABM1I4C7_POLDO|nr:PREDICTED: neural/ectodermal development factor IMP-L2 isoform X1 [Polistes dominula]